MKLFSILRENIFKKSFVNIFVLTLFLYSFSFRFSFVTYIVPVSYFLVYIFFNRKLIINLKASVFYMLLGVLASLLLIGGLIGLDFEVRVKSAMYLFLFFFSDELYFLLRD